MKISHGKSVFFSCVLFPFHVFVFLTIFVSFLDELLLKKSQNSSAEVLN